MKIALALLPLLFGILFACNEAAPLAAVVDTRVATLICGALTALLALLLRKRWRIVFVAAGLVLVLLASSWYLRYTAENVAFRSDVPLAGTIISPRGIARPPMVVYIHGSGPATRREFRHYAQLLARHGIASLIYDKRTPVYSVGYDGYARDAAAALRLAATRSDDIFVFGQSEAEWVLPQALVVPIRGVIMSSGSILTPAEQVLAETRGQLRRRGYSEAIVQRAQELQRRVLDYERTGHPSPGLDAELRRASKEPWFEASELPDRVWPIEEYRWWRGVMDFDARPYWRRVTVPVLALSGARDPKTEGARSQQRLRALVKGPFEGHVFPRGEHGMIEWCIGERIPPPCWPEGLPEILMRWIKQTARRKA